MTQRDSTGKKSKQGREREEKKEYKFVNHDFQSFPFKQANGDESFVLSFISFHLLKYEYIQSINDRDISYKTFVKDSGYNKL